MAAAGLLVYVLESAQIDNDLHQQIDQEIAELRALQGGTDPRTTEPFDSVQRLLKLYLDRNVTDDDEMLVTYVDGEFLEATPNQFGEAILSEEGYQDTVAKLFDRGRHRGDRQPRATTRCGSPSCRSRTSSIPPTPARSRSSTSPTTSAASSTAPSRRTPWSRSASSA